MIRLSFIALLCAGVVAACGNRAPIAHTKTPQSTLAAHFGNSNDAATPKSAPLSKTNAAPSPEDAARNSITMNEAIKVALAQNPTLKIALEEINRRDALIEQAGLYPNTELTIDAEDFLGSGVARGASGIQVTTSLSQPIELGGKRRTRKSAASLDRTLAAQGFEEAEIRLITDVRKAFIDLLAAQRKKTDAEDMVRITQDVYETFQAQMAAGKLTSIEINNAKVARTMAGIAATRAEREVSACKAVLCAHFGKAPCDFSLAVGEFKVDGTLPEPESLLPYIDESPAVQAAATAVELGRAEWEKEKAIGRPDMSVSLGYRWINDPGDSAMVAGATVPLPFGNRNQGAIRAAAAAVTQAELNLDAIRTELTATLKERMETLSAAWTAAMTLEQDVLPPAIETLDAIREGSRLGRFGYLDILRAEETLFRVREDLIVAVTEYHRAKFDVEQLIARVLEGEEKTTRTVESTTLESEKAPITNEDTP